MKRLIYQFHSWLGLIAGLGLVIIGLTGSLLVFKEELDGVIAKDLVTIPDASRPRLDHDTFLANLQARVPDHLIAGWGRSPRAGRADAVYVVPLGASEGKMLYVDPTTGIPRNPDISRNETTTDWLLELHYSFLADHTGEWIAGILATALCLLGITGVWIYRGFWKTLFKLRWKKSARIFFSDLHKMVGISSTLFNLLLGFTGAWWNLSHLIGHLVEGDAPEPVVTSITRNWGDDVSINKLVDAARLKLPGYQENWVELPVTKDGDITLYGDIQGQSPLRSPYGSTVIFDGATGELKSAVSAASSGAWDQILDSFKPLHYGTFGGLPVKILWSLGGLAPGILAVSGALMFWKRKIRPRKSL